jgi:hypothetical protein
MGMSAIRVVLVLLLALPASVAVAESDAQKAFDKLKSLEGMWEGKTAEGQSVKVIYHVISGESA